MGGSGGVFFPGGNSPDEISKRIRSEEQTKDQAFEIKVTDLIRTLLSNVNDRDTNQIQTHIQRIKQALNLGVDGTIDLRYGGSLSKNTFVEGLSDIDTLAILNKSELMHLSPNEVKDYFYDRIRESLPYTDIVSGKKAVTINFTSEYSIQILPALKDGNGIRIPSSSDPNEWSKIIQPKKFVETLRYVNIKNSGKLIPVIKLAKSIISTLPERRQLSGYHVEALGIEVFSNYSGDKTPKAMLKHFFTEASKKVLEPIKDKTGQTIHVDNYLKAANSIERKMVSDSLSTVSRKMQNADGSKDIRAWNEILK
ncbi:CBASS oligonucleotide cyclase [Fluviicola sp.]|uniref:CBASS oligonucleotide cyclase n=1 Tax=Fluviicola sp. TaxID=1917219 RepID=UPI0031E1C295